jgi:hypothetical protein
MVYWNTLKIRKHLTLTFNYVYSIQPLWFLFMMLLTFFNLVFFLCIYHYYIFFFSFLQIEIEE